MKQAEEDSYLLTTAVGDTWSICTTNPNAARTSLSSVAMQWRNSSEDVSGTEEAASTEFPRASRMQE
jgi:hypothetical protein